jgi:hypothetical protein
MPVQRRDTGDHVQSGSVAWLVANPNLASMAGKEFLRTGRRAMRWVGS